MFGSETCFLKEGRSPRLLNPSKTPVRLHTYPASFGHDLARELIADNMVRGQYLLDPWVGSATGPIQARMLGINGIAIDIDPIACLISSVSLMRYDIDELDDVVAYVINKLEFVESELSSFNDSRELWLSGTVFSVGEFQGIVPANNAVDFWFAPIQRAVLALLVDISDSIGDLRHQAIVKLAISASIIRKWPNTISLAMDIDHSRPHRVPRENITVASQTKVFRRVITNIIKHLKTINESGHEHDTKWEIIEGDTKVSLSQIAPGSIDYILTSPPYFNAIDYPRSHKFSQWWLWPDQEPVQRARYLGLMPGVKDHEAFVECRRLASEFHDDLDPLFEASPSTHRRLCKYIIELNCVVAQFERLLKKGGKATFVVGDNNIQGHKVPTSELLATMLDRSGLSDLRIEPRMIRKDRRRYPFGIRGFKGPMQSEYIVHAYKH